MIAYGDDAEQEAHLKVYSLLDREFNSWDHLRAWVHNVVRNTLFELRGGTLRRREEIREDPYDGVAHPLTEGGGEKTVMGRAVQEAMERMPEGLRPYAHGYAMAEAKTTGWGCASLAKMLGHRPETVQKRVDAAFDWLRWELVDE